jgi:hypothetical protein
MMPGIGHSFYWNGGGAPPASEVFREGNMYLSSEGVAAHGMIRLGIFLVGLSWLSYPVF